MGPYQVLTLRVTVDQETMATKGYSAFPNTPTLQEPHHPIVLCHIRAFVGWGGSYSSAEKQSVYSTAQPMEQYQKGVVAVRLYPLPMGNAPNQKGDVEVGLYSLPMGNTPTKKGCHNRTLSSTEG